jgi:hypothetical protein
MTPNDTHTHTLDRTSLDEGSACRRDLYLTTNNTEDSQRAVRLAGFELPIQARERPQTHALDCAATGIGDDEPNDRNMWKGNVA